MMEDRADDTIERNTVNITIHRKISVGKW